MQTSSTTLQNLRYVFIGAALSLLGGGLLLLFAWPWHPSHWWGWGVLCFMSVPLLTLFASFWHVVAQAFARSKATMYLSSGEIFWRRTKFAILLLSYLTLIGLVSHWLGGFL